MNRMSTDERTLLGLITDVQLRMARMFRERTQHLGITRSQWRVLSGLHGRPGVTQTELAEHVAIGRAPLGKIIDKLEASGWVERRADPDDRRVNRLFLTQDFAPLAEPTREISRGIEDEVLDGIAAEDREAFYRVMRALHRKLGFDDEVATAETGRSASTGE
jgi:MarR family transcriptional regulator for hemolysin